MLQTLKTWLEDSLLYIKQAFTAAGETMSIKKMSCCGYTLIKDTVQTFMKLYCNQTKLVSSQSKLSVKSTVKLIEGKLDVIPIFSLLIVKLFIALLTIAERQKPLNVITGVSFVS